VKIQPQWVVTPGKETNNALKLSVKKEMKLRKSVAAVNTYWR
jgi:hypothetical protein